jgi:hypothetical protein
MAVGVASKFLEVHCARIAGLIAAVKPPEIVKAPNSIVFSNLQGPPAPGARRTVLVDYIKAHSSYSVQNRLLPAKYA